MRNRYKKIYVIRIEKTTDFAKWYFNKDGRTYDADMIQHNKRPHFKIDNVHKIPCEHATIVEIKMVTLYQKL